MQTEERLMTDISKRAFKERVAIARAYVRADGIWELDRICRIYLRELIDVVHCEECAIMLVDGGKATVLAGKGHPEAVGTTPLTTDIPVINYVVNTKRTYFYEHTTDGDEKYDFIPGWTADSLICSPIVLKDVVRGVICLASDEKQAFRREDMEFAEYMSRELSFAFKQSLQVSNLQVVTGEDMLLGCRARCLLSIDLAREISIARRRQEQVSLLVMGTEGPNGEGALKGCPKPDVGKKILNTLKWNVRAYHKIYVYGLGQFVLLMTDTRKEEALLVAKRLVKVLERQQNEGTTPSANKIEATVRVGVVAFPSDGDNVDKMTELIGSLLCPAED